MDSEELVALVAASVALAAGAAARARRGMPFRRLLRRVAGVGALIGAAALVLAD